MSIQYCHECGKHIDTDFNAEHFPCLGSEDNISEDKKKTLGERLNRLDKKVDKLELLAKFVKHIKLNGYESLEEFEKAQE